MSEFVNVATRRRDVALRVRLGDAHKDLGSSGRLLHAHDPVPELQQNSHKDLSELA